MKLRHTFDVELPPAEAWAVLTDVERVGPCLPGASITRVDGDEFTGRVAVKVGPIRAEYAGEGRFVSRDPEAGRALLEARGKETRGKGGASAEVTIAVDAHPDASRTTRVDVTTDLSISGRLAQFGRGVITDVADRLLGEFVGNLESQVGPDATTADHPASGTETGEPPAGTTPHDDAAGAGSAIEGGDPIPAVPRDTSLPTTSPPATDSGGAPTQLLAVLAVPVVKRLAPAVLVMLLGWVTWRRTRRRG